MDTSEQKLKKVLETIESYANLAYGWNIKSEDDYEDFVESVRELL